MDKQTVRNNSIVLIGPVGVGKSVIAENLHRKTNLPLITTDLMRHCPKSLDKIKARKQFSKQNFDKLKAELDMCVNPDRREEIKHNLRKLENDMWVCDRQFEMRKMLPKLPNYEDMGFNGKVSNFLSGKFGMVAWHFYQKRFETKLFSALIDQLDTPAIIDVGGGMPITLDKEYNEWAKKFKSMDENLYNQHFDITQIGFDKIKNTLTGFNVINLELPQNYKQNFFKAKNNPINDNFIKSGQYKQLATTTITTNALITGNKVNEDVLNNITFQIVTLSKNRNGNSM